jgi:TPR repeat protein
MERRSQIDLAFQSKESWFYDVAGFHMNIRSSVCLMLSLCLVTSIVYGAEDRRQSPTDGESPSRRAVSQETNDADSEASIMEAGRLELLRKSAERGIARAQNGMGYAYAHGVGTPRDLTEAARWYRAAAEQGCAEAQYNLAYMHEHGLGVQQSHRDAAEWYQKAVAQGFASAENNLAVLYERHPELSQNRDQIVTLLNLAAEQGDAPAQYNLGEAYFSGRVVRRDVHTALALIFKGRRPRLGSCTARPGLSLRDRYRCASKL